VPSTDLQVFQTNFGRNEGSPHSMSTAYILNYIKESMMDELLEPCTELDIPPFLGLPFFCSLGDKTFLCLSPSQCKGNKKRRRDVGKPS